MNFSSTNLYCSCQCIFYHLFYLKMQIYYYGYLSLGRSHYESQIFTFHFWKLKTRTLQKNVSKINPSKNRLRSNVSWDLYQIVVYLNCRLRKQANQISPHTYNRQCWVRKKNSKSSDPYPQNPSTILYHSLK